MYTHMYTCTHIHTHTCTHTYTLPYIQGWTGVSCNTNTSKSLDELISSSTLPFSDNSLSVSPSPSSQHHYLHSLSSSSPSPPQTNGPGVISSEVLHSPSIDNIMKCNNRSDYM